MARADELKRLLLMSAGTSDGNPDRSHITNLEHNLRVATLARRFSGGDTELTFMALIHDLARPLSDPYHGEVIAEIVRDMVSDITYNILRTHGQYQASVIHGTPVDETTTWHKYAMWLCGWEITSFKHSWDIPTMTIDEAYDVIDAICQGRD